MQRIEPLPAALRGIKVFLIRTLLCCLSAKIKNELECLTRFDQSLIVNSYFWELIDLSKVWAEVVAKRQSAQRMS